MFIGCVLAYGRPRSLELFAQITSHFVANRQNKLFTVQCDFSNVNSKRRYLVFKRLPIPVVDKCIRLTNNFSKNNLAKSVCLPK